MTSIDNNVSGQENSKGNLPEWSFTEEMLFKIPSVALLVYLPDSGEYPQTQLVFANSNLLKLTGYDPKQLKSENCDFFAHLLHPEDLCIMTKALQCIVKSPRQEFPGLVFRINAAWNECLYVICTCRLYFSGSPQRTFVICNWLVFDQKNFPGEDLRKCLKMYDRIEKEKLLLDLTPREKEILKYLGEGLTYQEISDKLYISYYTVETHISNIKSKLGLHCINALITFAISVGL